MNKDTSRRHFFEISSFALHLIAMALMLCDHLWATFLSDHAWLTQLGRIAFPIFAFLLAEGFFRSKNRKKYALRLLIFALLSELPFNLMTGSRFFYPLHQNVLWTFLIAFGLMCVLEKIKVKPRLLLRLPLYALATLAAYLLGFLAFVDYYGYGVLMVALFYFTHSLTPLRGWRRAVQMLAQLLGMYWINVEMMKGLMIPVTLFGLSFEFSQQGFALFSLPLLWLYRGEHGPYNRAIRALNYGFYPAHILILGLLVRFL